MKKVTLHYKTIILSDIHLGTRNCQVEKVNYFLRHADAERIILNGDIIDGWNLKRQGVWKSEHTRFLRMILKRVEKNGVEVIYLRGNHDDILGRFLPMQFGKLSILEEFIHETKKGRYLVVHGDVFDAISQKTKWLAVLGDIGYRALMRLNRVYNKYRSWRGKEYFSISKLIKAKVKHAVNYVSNFEQEVELLAKRKNCVGIMCGHIHTPADKMIGNIHYLNSGDWVESATALVEHFDGRFEILEYSEFCRRLKAKTKNLRAKTTQGDDFVEEGKVVDF
jgi:UDP-2,3-diacylglucosamine pyrophosphatase LpxH